MITVADKVKILGVTLDNKLSFKPHIDHWAKDCRNELKCYICEENGHRADSMRSQEYQEECSKRDDLLTLKILQCNVGRGRAATALIEDAVYRRGIDVVMLQEPNINLTSTPSWFRDLDKCVASKIYKHGLYATKDDIHEKDWVWMVPVLHSGGTSMSYIDLTLTTEDIARKVVKWEVLEEENLSDHAYISFELKNDTAMSPALTIKNMGWCLNNVEGFIDRFEEGIQEWREQNESMTVE
ncbi:hypothetical protein J6590_089106 [Homalodisca vitripennis]|nr:hypothetical protein J6590_088596 [Homalodisca vitripennis]KAG8319571.1 hypothetical protein J6590_089106 [Homalodisca vitripennis]